MAFKSLFQGSIIEICCDKEKVGKSSEVSITQKKKINGRSLQLFGSIFNTTDLSTRYWTNIDGQDQWQITFIWRLQSLLIRIVTFLRVIESNVKWRSCNLNGMKSTSQHPCKVWSAYIKENISCSFPAPYSYCWALLD